MNRAVFLDRDGVITQEPPHYAHELSQLVLIPRAIEAIRLLNKHDFMVIVASNQAGIAHGYYSEEDASLFNQRMSRDLAKEGAHISAIYYCPHHPEAEVEGYRADCNCRKPGVGMLTKAKRELNIDLNQSFMIGDKSSDMEAGKRAGCKTIMVRTGYGSEQRNNSQIECDYIADDLYDAVGYILHLSNNLEKTCDVL